MVLTSRHFSIDSIYFYYTNCTFYQSIPHNAFPKFGQVPYLNLPGTGMEYNARSGRGYSLGRFRGKQMLYLESEYRFTISEDNLFGGVLFANLQSLEEPGSDRFQYANPGIGFGARIKFNKASNINLDLDFGFGKDSFNFYVNLGELF